LEDLQFWKQSGNIKIQNKITKLLESIQETPFEGIGKPEALKHECLATGQVLTKNIVLFTKGKMER